MNVKLFIFFLLIIHTVIPAAPDSNARLSQEINAFKKQTEAAFKNLEGKINSLQVRIAQAEQALRLTPAANTTFSPTESAFQAPTSAPIITAPPVPVPQPTATPTPTQTP